MSFFEHLDEARVRLVRAAAVFMLGFFICFFVTNEWVMGFLRGPLFEALEEVLGPDQMKLHYTGLFENFLTHLKVAGISSIFLVSPYLFWELWGFISPGLYQKEKRATLPFVFVATLFFIGGAAFAYYVLFPTAFRFFLTFGLDADTPLLTIQSYYGTAMKLLLLFGACFELPVLVCLLGFLGIIDAPMLRKYRQQSIIGITVICAMFAPPDAISMLIMMAPMILLYEASIWVVAALGSRRKRVREAED